ncbi:MAG: hypothetical protein EAY72_00640, partial [Bacteroidetes bacterium]
MRKICTLLLAMVFYSVTMAQNWTWMTGNINTVNHNGNWNVIGTEGSDFISSRRGAAYWKDNQGRLWLFGGEFSSAGGTGQFWSDMWRYNPTTNAWTWMKGPSMPSQPGTYGTKGVAAATNNPGCRAVAACATDNNGDFWMYGGFGYAATAGDDRLCDLWKYTVSTNTWTWMGGSSTGVGPTYGTMGTPSATVEPGGRSEANMWIVGNKIYIQGGIRGYNGIFGYTASDDMFSFDITTNQFTYIKGSSSNVVAMVTNTAGTENATSTPGSRYAAHFWKDASDNLWLFGGKRVTGQFDVGYANDLWKFNPTTNNWTFVKGETTTNGTGTYGTLNTPAPTNMPRARSNTFGGAIGASQIIIFGGESTNINTLLNDAWMFDVVSNNWTWIGGTNTTNNFSSAANFVFRVESATASPQALSAGASYIMPNGDLWLIAGWGLGNTSTRGFKSTVWRYRTSAIALPVSIQSFSGRITNQTTTLHWQTGTEINAQQFEVEYSTNGANFTKVHTIPARNLNGSSYTATHTIANAAKHYYRLKMIDKDGSFTYSTVVI